jgi:hypothetical protein
MESTSRLCFTKGYSDMVPEPAFAIQEDPKKIIDILMRIEGGAVAHRVSRRAGTAEKS